LGETSSFKSICSAIESRASAVEAGLRKDYKQKGTKKNKESASEEKTFVVFVTFCEIRRRWKFLMSQLSAAARPDRAVQRFVPSLVCARSFSSGKDFREKKSVAIV
jgi:hypothetical protein